LFPIQFSNFLFLSAFGKESLFLVNLETFAFSGQVILWTHLFRAYFATTSFYLRKFLSILLPLPFPAFGDFSLAIPMHFLRWRLLEVP